jgi:hypothetical protein
MEKTIKIYESGEKSLTRAVKRLSRHAAKMGYAEPKIVSIGKPYETMRTVIMDNPDAGPENRFTESRYAICVRDVVIDLPSQFLNQEDADWNVIGQIVQADNGEVEVIGEPVTFKEISKAAEGYAWKCNSCAHGLGRAFAIQAKVDASKILFVGSECLKKYTGADGHAVLAAIEAILFLQIKEGSDDNDRDFSSRGGRCYHAYDLDDFMAVAIAVVERDGAYAKRWMDRGYGDMYENPNCTRNAILSYYGGQSKIEITDAHREKAVAQVEAWIGCYLPERNGKPDDYVSQCKMLAERGWVTEKTAGVAASMVKNPPVPPKDYSGSKHLGEIGKRQVFENLTVIGSIEREGDYGITTILKFEDSDGNVLTWFASGSQSYNKGDVVTLKATVKDHSEYQGVKQTIITRAKEVESKKEPVLAVA